MLTAAPGFFDRCVESGSRSDIAGLLAFRTLIDIEIDTLAFFQCFEAIHVDGREMCKQIFTAIIGGDETKAFGVIEPLNGTSCHLKHFVA